MLEASLIVVGDEILSGYVTDTNSPWLADRLREHGVPLTRVHTVPDDAAAIDEALTAELARSRPRVVFTSGGIGSTPDDLTYEAVAASLGRALVEDPAMGQRIQGALAWSREQGLDVTDEFAWHLGRMARIPAGSRLLWREGGWSPGVAVDVDGGVDGGLEGPGGGTPVGRHRGGPRGATVVVLPGVPSEFRAIVGQVIEPQLLADRNEVPAVRELEHPYPESVLNTTFTELMRREPEVKLGSYPGRPMLVRLSGPEDAVDRAAELVRTALDELDASPAGRRLAAAWQGTTRRDTSDDHDHHDHDPEEDDA